MKSRIRPAFAAVAALFALAQLALAEPPATRPTVEPDTRFTRMVKLDNGDAMLETAEVMYRNADGVTVTLIGAVHIADPEYFSGLDASFDHYDALLYEMVKPPTKPGESVRTARRSGSIAWIGAFQRFLRNNLDLEFQLEAIRYDDRPNFVHADLDSEQFLRMQEERREGFFKLFLRAMAAEGRRQREGGPSAAEEFTPFHLLAALKAPDRPRQLKLLFAKQLQNVEQSLEVLEGPNGSVILTERNKVAMNVLRDQLAAGRKNVGVFYGAGHLPGMEKILVHDMGFEKLGHTWRTAWDMSEAKLPATRPSQR
jgi:hypothetical protein